MIRLIRLLFLILLAQYFCEPNCEDVTFVSGYHCLDGQVDEGKACVYSNGEGGKDCKVVTLCGSGHGNSDEECNQYVVQEAAENYRTVSEDVACIFDSSNKQCSERYFCNSAGSSEEYDRVNSNCEIFPVSYEKKNTHICVTNPKGDFDSPCMEQEKPVPIITTVPLNTPEIKETQKALSEKVSLGLSTIVLKTTIPNIATTENEVPTTTKTERVPLSTIALKTTIPNIATTENEIIVPTTIINNKVPITTIIEEKKEEKEETSVVFLGCGKLVMKTASFTFIIYFVLVKNSIHAKNIIIIIVIIYNSYLRRLENHEAVCTLDETNTNSIIGYKCNVQAPTANIRQIKLEDNFNFGSDNNMKLVGITPIAKLFMENLQEANDNYGNLLSSENTVYILDNSTLYQNETSHFGIYGILNGEKPKTITKNKNLTLMANIEFESENKTKEINCTVTDIKNDNYTLTCEATENLKYYFQSALSVIDDGLLLINFDVYKNENNSILDTENDREISNFRFNYNKSKGLNGGTIVAIILPCIVVLAAVIGIIYYLKKTPKRTDHTESSADNIINFKY